MVTDERGTARRVELWMEKVGTSEKEEKEHIMRCLTKTIYDSVESSKGQEQAADAIAIKSWKEPWIVSSKKGEIQADIMFHMTDRAVHININEPHFDWVRKHYKDNFKVMFRHLVPHVDEGND
eukprot:9051422-Karenia_brevis.AAC.1